MRFVGSLGSAFQSRNTVEDQDVEENVSVFLSSLYYCIIFYSIFVSLNYII
jgi:hypothetical protein